MMMVMMVMMVMMAAVMTTDTNANVSSLTSLLLAAPSSVHIEELSSLDLLEKAKRLGGITQGWEIVVGVPLTQEILPCLIASMSRLHLVDVKHPLHDATGGVSFENKAIGSQLCSL